MVEEYSLKKELQEFIFSKVKNDRIEFFNEYLMACCLHDQNIKEHFDKHSIDIDYDLYANVIFGLVNLGKKFPADYINFYWLSEFLHYYKGMPLRRLRRMSYINLKRCFQMNQIQDIREYQNNKDFINIHYYRKLCSFNLDNRMLKHVKGYNLLVKYGWYHPVRNPGGVVKDHRYSIHYGFINQINPSIMGHPVNCEFLTMRQNSSKGANSSIILNELRSEIAELNRILTSI